jgi:pimeloyl-ACP methyl ester carboxylesterase
MTVGQSIPSAFHAASGSGRARRVLVMLPGVGMAAQEFVDHGFIAALRAQRAPVDVVVADAHADLYLEGSILERLEHDVIAPALARGYDGLWLLGVSLGGMGALAYARLHPGRVKGILLLAPFLGVPGTIAEVRRAGGLAAWEPGPLGDDRERAVLAWLKDHGPGDPTLLLGYGVDDRFAAGHALLAARLPAERVATCAGGHDWETWSRLWRMLLERQPFAPPYPGAVSPC